MIVDSHAHVFPPMGGSSGHPTARQHMRYVQHMLMFHHQPVRRLDDDSIVTGPDPRACPCWVKTSIAGASRDDSAFSGGGDVGGAPQYI